MIDQNEVEAVAIACPPSSNTGGNLVTPPVFQEKDVVSFQKCKIDYLSFTSRKQPHELVELFNAVIKNIRVVPNPRGWVGYPHSATIFRGDENIGLLAYGAPHGRNFFSISGAGCRYWNDWCCQLVRELLKDAAARITRIDLALDFYRGEVSYEDCEAALAGGKFSLKQGGRKPAVDRYTSEGHYGNKGRTLYVGAASSSKRMCCYEKGLEQFGRLPAKWLEEQGAAAVASHTFDLENFGGPGDARVADWLRMELRYSNDDRNLDYDDYAIVVDRDAAFAGANPFNAEVLELADGVRPPTLMTEVEGDIEKMKLACKDSYGGLVRAMRLLGETPEKIVADLMGLKPAKRLVKAGYLAHLENKWSDVPF
jgi:DNA relaxase NicK